MVNRIKKLHKSVSNRIAAGEVVERPASVVKELLENSIDANSSSIVIEIKEAGKSYIRISDDGVGIKREDLNLAFERHATSKIYSDEEIYDIKSLGFRGEALASIASVSNIEIITRTSEDEFGTKAELMNGDIIRNSSIGCPNGTTIVVKDLFYNTPARHKFLKSNSAETNYISTIVNNIALSHPYISFRYIIDNRNIFTTQGKGDLYSTIYTIYGREVAKNLIEVNNEDGDMKLKGYITNTSYTRGNRSLQISFVNGRYVKSKVISKAIDTGYKTLLPQNRFSICFLYLETPSNKVDVNIHPAKLQIRFRDERRVMDFLTASIKEKLLKSDLIPDINISNSSRVKEEKIDDISEQLSIGIKENRNTFTDEDKYRKIQPVEKKEYPQIKNHDTCIEDNIEYNKDNINQQEREEKIEEIFDEVFTSESKTIKYPKKEKTVDDKQHPLDEIRIIGQLFSTYIICEKGEEMLLIDQHAAHERILYEKFMNDYLNSEILSQILLEPIVIELNYIDKDLIMENKNIFSKLGYKIEEFGYNTIILREVPILFGAPIAKKFFLEAAENLNNTSKNSYEFKIHRLIQMSCKKAIKAADKLKNIEIEKLIADLKKTENSFTCPHGRPIIISISKSEIERKFLRT